jgi:hypothetical protein
MGIGELNNSPLVDGGGGNVMKIVRSTLQTTLYKCHNFTSWTFLLHSHPWLYNVIDNISPDR